MKRKITRHGWYFPRRNRSTASGALLRSDFEQFVPCERPAAADQACCTTTREGLALTSRIGLPPQIPYSLHLVVHAILSPVVISLKERPHMEWVTPQHEEIDLNCEISSYANAEL